jgi:hypothetical protein
MWSKIINRASPEQVFISVKNEYSGTASVGHAVHWNFPITNGGAGTGNGYGVTFPATVATSQAYAGLFAGVVAGEDIGQNEYGSVQVYGYHTGVYVSGAVTNATAGFDNDFFTVTNRASASFTNVILAPANAFGNTVGGATNAGYFGALVLPDSVTDTDFAALACLWPKGYCVPLGNINGGVSITATSTGSVKAFIKAL